MSDTYDIPPCPRCNSQDITEYVNGLPDMITITELESKGHSFIFNGCLVDGTEMDYHCNNCKNDFLDPYQSEED